MVAKLAAVATVVDLVPDTAPSVGVVATEVAVAVYTASYLLRS